MLSRQLGAGALRKGASLPAFRQKNAFALSRGLAVRNASTASSSAFESFFNSRLTLVSVSLFTAGSVAWYTHLYGSLPFLSEVHASHASDEGLHPPAYPWSHKGIIDTFDHDSIRRGYQVYREVCAACHSLDRIAWRNLVGVSHTVDEVKAMAEEGEMFMRPGKLADYMPNPLRQRARHGGAVCSSFERDYVYSIITGYVDPPPAGVEIREGMSYNPFFPGGAIGMARVLYDGLVDFEDGTPATASQMAKDVVTFLSWAAEPEHDERKKNGIKAVILFSALTLISLYVKRFKWTPLKNRKLIYDPPVDKTH
ncbi:cytochrome C1 family-domain-containing protein [Mycena filopes]|nr:cytochrome C1 family-domain-containing protein [Mycena filopes]